MKDLYSNKGRPSIEPVIKMLLIGYLYGIDSEKKLEQEIKINIAYRRFLGLELEDKVQTIQRYHSRSAEKSITQISLRKSSESA